MKIEEAIDFLEKYVELTKPLFGDVSITIKERERYIATSHNI